MSGYLLEVKAVLDEVLSAIDAGEHRSDRMLRRATLMLLAIEGKQDELPTDLKRRFSQLLSSLRENAWIQHPEAGLAEIKRFHVYVLKAMQGPHPRTLH